VVAIVDFKSAATEGKWISVASDGKDSTNANETDASKQKLKQTLTEIILSENLVVLAGLGTSVYITDPTGRRVAPSMAVLWAAVEQAAGKEFEGVKSSVRYVRPDAGDDIELLLSQCQMAERFSPNDSVKNFIASAESLIVDRCRFVNEETKLGAHESFLRKAARRSTRLPRLKLFTTNYDLCFEAAASHVRFVAVDGFSHTQPQEFDGIHFGYDFVRRGHDREAPEYIPNVFHLYKLHGSVDWELRGLQVVKTPAPPRPLIIYPRYSKFESSYDQPFIEMMSQFQLSLRQPNSGLLVIGVGFNDHHISQPIMSAVRANVGLKAAIVGPSLKEKENQNASLASVSSLIGKGDWRLTLIASTFEDLVSFLPDLVAETEGELYQQRVRSLGKSK
jgi:hypothetical protein